MIPFVLFADKEEPGDDEEGDSGNIIFQTANTCSGAPSDAPLLFHVILSSKIEF